MGRQMDRGSRADHGTYIEQGPGSVLEPADSGADNRVYRARQLAPWVCAGLGDERQFFQKEWASSRALNQGFDVTLTVRGASGQGCRAV